MIRIAERRAARRATRHEDEPEATATKTKGYSLEKHEEAIAKAEADAKTKAAEAKAKEAEAIRTVPVEPVVLPTWQNTTLPNKVEDKDKTVGDWIIQGVTAIVDEHKLTSLTAWRDVAGNVVVEYVEDPRAMYALRKA